MYGDFQPDCPEIHVPVFRWKHLWLKYSHSLEAKHYGVVPYHSFNASRPKWLKKRKNKRFAQCPICNHWDVKMEKASSSLDVKSCRIRKDVHLDWQMRERSEYYNHKTKATRFRSTHCSIAIDGMDHSKTCLPHYVRVSKDLDGTMLLNSHVTAVLNHGTDHFATVYLWSDRLPSDSNTTIEFIVQELESMAEQNRLPMVVWVQLDNTSRENKNRYIMAFFHLLVEMGLVELKVKPCFLPVGHTHEDVDQLFSLIVKALQQHDCVTVPDLAAVIRSCTSKPLKVKELKSVGMWNRWMDLHIASTGTTHRMRDPACFIIKKDHDGVVRHVYKEEMQHKKKENPRHILPINRPGFIMWPNGIPRYPFKINLAPYR
jgi:hypothetical protein